MRILFKHALSFRDVRFPARFAKRIRAHQSAVAFHARLIITEPVGGKHFAASAALIFAHRHPERGDKLRAIFTVKVGAQMRAHFVVRVAVREQIV
ncbi:MAG: hypothetical protein OXU71_11370 [Gammaproteobacteria bacterium]|nr:hypothetical protein [Gammaproteobacteria bacterium]